MKVSIITVVLNNRRYISECIESVLNQTYGDIEYIVVDGASTDGTLEVIYKYKDRIAKIISEPDKGIYDAMNKGIAMATGDIVGILNSDDIYADEYVIEDVVKTISENGVDSCYGDLVYVDKEDTSKVIRYWKSGNFYKERFKKGWVPPHPTFFVRRECYEKYGNFNTKFRVSADYDLMLRFLWVYGISTYYIPRVLVKMRVGGHSNNSMKNIVRKSLEDYRILKVNYIDHPLLALVFKKISKLPQFFVR